MVGPLGCHGVVKSRNLRMDHGPNSREQQRVRELTGRLSLVRHSARLGDTFGVVIHDLGQVLSKIAFVMGG
jgi:hypothetical protein